jgi:hypothetical protein
MHVCATLGSTVRDCEKKFIKRKISKEKVKSRYISRMRGGALIQPIAMEVCTFVKVTNVINHANFGGCMLRGLVSAKGQFRLFL